jgi:hypothetical protein
MGTSQSQTETVIAIETNTPEALANGQKKNG